MTEESSGLLLNLTSVPIRKKKVRDEKDKY